MPQIQFNLNDKADEWLRIYAAKHNISKQKAADEVISKAMELLGDEDNS